MGTGIYLFKNKKITIEQVIPTKVENKITYDTSKWLTYPPKGSYTGWTIKYPAENAPMATEKDTRIIIYNGEKEAIMISLNRDSKAQESTISEYLQTQNNYEKCALKTDFTKISLNGYDTYKSTSDCSSKAIGDSIFLKEKTTYIIVSPYAKGDYVTADVYTDKDIAQASDKTLAQKILETITILEPEKPLKEGFIGFSDPTLGFEIIYPENYKQKQDPAWEHAELLLYSGGQVYDLVVQVWNTADEYKKYFGENYSNIDKIVVHKVKDKYVTFFNMAESEEVDEIIKSFTLEE